jgi:hypothetical protein
MSNEPTTPQAKPVAKRRPTLIVGGVVLAFSLYLLVFLVPDVIRSASGPKNMTLAEAASTATDQSTYVKIEDGVWRCDTIRYIRGRSSTNSLATTTRFTEIFLTDDETPEQIVMLASLSGEKECDDFDGSPPDGYLTRMSDSKQRELTNNVRLARFFDATEFLEFCDYCGPENSLIGVAFGVVFALAGVAILIVGYRMPKDVKPDLLVAT